MDLRLLAKCIVFLGLIFAGYAVVTIATNRPVEVTKQAALPFTSQNALENMNRGLGNIQRSFEIQHENEKRERARQGAMKPLIGGLVVVFIGGALLAAAKRVPQQESQGGR